MDNEIGTAHPNGHFYSPVVNPEDLRSKSHEVWPDQAPKVLGIDFNHESHLKVLQDWFPRHISNYNYPETLENSETGGDTFYTRNSQFGWLDSRVLFVILNEIRPSRLIEVGSGYSSLLVADVNKRFLDLSCEFICIEPYPREFLARGIKGVSRLITQQVQDTSASLYESLEPGDILFIDSSHVCKTCSDVNFLYFEVFPRLKSGVLIHIHDIFIPFEYPKEWVLDENRSWNEQYLLRALLMYSSKFHVMFGSKYAYHRFPGEVSKALNLKPKRGFGGGSFWLLKD